MSWRKTVNNTGYTPSVKAGTSEYRKNGIGFPMDRWPRKVLYMGEGQQESWPQVIYQTSVTLSGEPRNFMEATLNETLSQLEGCPPVRSLTNCQSFPPLPSTGLSGRSGVHRGGVLSFQHPSSQEQGAFYCSAPYPNPVACPLMKTAWLSLTAEIWNLEYPRNLMLGEGERKRL